MSEFTMAEIVSLAKMRGIIFPGSEIYDGLANSWDYGPLGVEMKNNVKKSLVEKICSGTEIQSSLTGADGFWP